MQALRLNEVLTRVVAWHNRHPLARRINAAQVHSVGEVLLPFASARPAPLAAPAQVATAPAAEAPALHDLLDPPAAAAPHAQAQAQAQAQAEGEGEANSSPATTPESQADELFGNAMDAPVPQPGTQSESIADPFADPFADPIADPFADPFEDPMADPAAQDSAEAAAAPAADDADGTEVLIELSTDADDDPAAPSEKPAQDDDAWTDPATADLASAELASAFATVADPPTPSAVSLPDEPAPHPAVPAEPTEAAAAAKALAAAPLPLPAGLADAGTAAIALHLAPSWRARLARLWPGSPAPTTGSAGALPKLQATFSRDFIWPLRPAQVARWARRHGSLAALAPADWPQRVIDTDGALMARARQQQLPHDLTVHLLTAAIGVGDRRIRVLIDAQGRVIGPRSYSPPRLAAAACVMALGLLGAGGAWLPRAHPGNTPETLAAVAAAASAAALAATAAQASAAAASAAVALWRAQAADAAAPAPANPPAQAPADAAPAEAPNPADAQVAPTALAQAANADAPAGNHASHTGTDPAAAASPGNLRLPTWISEADTQAARAQTQTLRSAAEAATAAALARPRAPAPVFAVVTKATLERDSAARSLALMRASRSRLTGVPPDNGELMQNGREWRAAWWPFDSQADAERARVMLTARGLKAEVVEF